MHSLRPRCAFFWTRISTGDCVAIYWTIRWNPFPLIGWAGIENGELLRKAVEAGFDVLVTMDSNMVHQQNIGQYAISVVALRAQSNRLANTRPLMPALLALLPNIKPATVTFLPEAA